MVKRVLVPGYRTLQKKISNLEANFSLSEAATLSNLPIYYLFTPKIPKKIAQETESLQKQFLWEGNIDFKHYLIKWGIVYQKQEGGSGSEESSKVIKELQAPSSFHSLKPLERYFPNFTSFLCSTKFSLDNGSKIRFWLDPWISSHPFSSLFSKNVQHFYEKIGKVSEFFPSSNWNIHLRRNIRH